jgi:hypothetical protein
MRCSRRHAITIRPSATLYPRRPDRLSCPRERWSTAGVMTILPAVSFCIGARSCGQSAVVPPIFSPGLLRRSLLRVVYSASRRPRTHRPLRREVPRLGSRIGKPHGAFISTAGAASAATEAAVDRLDLTRRLPDQGEPVQTPDTIGRDCAMIGETPEWIWWAGGGLLALLMLLPIFKHVWASPGSDPRRRILPRLGWRRRPAKAPVAIGTGVRSDPGFAFFSGAVERRYPD